MLFCIKKLGRKNLLGVYNNLKIVKMAKSKFEYVKEFENNSICLPNCWIVVRIDGINFSRFSDAHQFIKPNDGRSLQLMNKAATVVMDECKEIVLAYGQSDEYSFVFKKKTTLYNRRECKLMSMVNSLFTSAFVFHWSSFFNETVLKYPPSFDARVVLYPSERNLRDYLSWRQADVHINNLYNTCFWNLVQRENLSTTEAQEKLKGTVSADKNELLFQNFGINYNNEPQIYRKGTLLMRKLVNDVRNRKKCSILPVYDDIINDRFWNENPHLLELETKS